MDRKLRRILTESIRDIETGARDVEGCLQQHSDRAAELRPYLELWSGLNSAAKAQPSLGGRQRGQQQLLAALSDMEATEERRMIPFLTPALAKAAAVIAGVALLAIGAAGASAAFGGPDVAGDVLSSVGITSSHDNGTAADKLDDINDENPAAATDGLDTAEAAVDDPLNNIAGEAQPEAGDGPGASGAALDDAPRDSVPDDAPVPDTVPVGPNP